MDSDYEDLLVQRAKTLAMIQYLLNRIRSLLAPLQTTLENQQNADQQTKLTCNCCGPSKQLDDQ